MTEWLQVVPSFLLGVALLLLPGLALALALGLRGLWAFATAPAISTTLFAAASLALPLLGLNWNLLNASTFAVAFAAAIFLLFRFVLRTRFAGSTGSSPAIRRATGFAWALSGTVIAFWIVIGIGTPGGISQTFDNVFHLNAIAHIETTGNASPLAIGELTAPGSGGGFYPVAWHSIVALISTATGAGVAVALNGFNIAVAVMLWPLGMLLLVRQLVGSSATKMLLTGVLSAALPAFPLNMLFFGVLYPYFLGIALVPVTLAVLLQLLGITRAGVVGGKLGIAVLFAGLVPALALSHPVAMMTVLAISVPIVLVSFVSRWSALPFSHKLWRVIGLTAYGLIGFAMLYKLRPGVKWPPKTTLLDAVWRTFSLQLGGYGLPLVLAALTIVGIIAALRSRSRVGITLVGMWAVAAGLHFIAAGVSAPIRGVTGVWYGDTPRLEAVMPIVVIPLAVWGADWLLRGLKKSESPAVRQIVLSASLIALFVFTQLGSGYPTLIDKMQTSYDISNESILLSTDERALLERIDTQVGDDEMIAGNPWTGTSLAFAIAGRDVVMPHILMQLDGDRETIMSSLKFANSDPAVCNAVEDLNARWVLDFGTREVHGSKHTYAGLEGLSQAGVVELADEEGEARLYRVTACD